jgi:ankyrin repeat protein
MHTYNLIDLYEENPGKEALLDAYLQLISEHEDGQPTPPEDNLNFKDCCDFLAYTAAEHVHHEALQLLFDVGVNPKIIKNCSNGSNFTLLDAAAVRTPHHQQYIAPDEDTEQTVKLLLAKKVNPNATNSGVVSYLHAAEYGNWKFIKALADAGTRLTRTNGEGNTGLHIASIYGGRALNDISLWEKHSKNAEDDYQRENAKKQLDAAQKKAQNFYKTIKTFIDAGLEVDEKNNSNESAIDIARYADSKTIVALLNGEPFGDDAAADPQATLRLAAGGKDLAESIFSEDYEALDALIKLGTPVDTVYEKGSRKITALAAACAKFDVKATETLLTAGADPNLKNSNGRVAAAYAFDNSFRSDPSQKNFIPFIKTAISHGFEINAFANDKSDTLLNLACKNCRIFYDNTLPAIQEILAAGANPNISNLEGKTPLMYACQGNDASAEIALLLLENSADATTKDSDGNTALHYAAKIYDKNKAKTIAENLLDNGADAKAVNNDGKTALDFAVEVNNEPLIKLLLKEM